MDKIWQLSPVDPGQVLSLQSQLKISPSLCEILVRRGIFDYDAAKAFFRPHVSDLHDPFLMKDMDQAVARIQAARERQERVCIYGDYDVDGTTSVSLLYDFFKKYLFQDRSLRYYLPDRNTEGYGLSEKGMDYALTQDCSLMILADCGIKDTDKVNALSDKGIDVIIIDHHIPGARLPHAAAILNPKQADCNYPYKELSACGLVYKLVSALISRLRLSPGHNNDYLDWVTLSIASDIVPITGENRVLASLGLEKINQNPSPAVQIFKDKLAVNNKKLCIADLVFKIGPKINASGRITHASEVVKLFTATEAEEREAQISKLFQDNEERQMIDKDMTDEVFRLLEDSLTDTQRSIVVYKPSWHKGILGIVASRIVERFHKPTIVLTMSGDIITGSARSVRGFDLYESLYRCRHELIQFGGHAFAAGMTLKPDRLESFITAFESSVRDFITADSLTPVIEIDAEISLNDVTDKYVNILTQFEPCGPENHMPVFLIRGLYDTGYSKVVKDVHAQLFLSHAPDDMKSRRMKGIAFHHGEWISYLKEKKPIDVVCHIEKEYWNGNEYNNMRVLDIRKSCQ